MLMNEHTIRTAPPPHTLWYSIDPTNRGDDLLRYEFYAEDELVGFGKAKSLDEMMLQFDALVKAAMRPLC